MGHMPKGENIEEMENTQECTLLFGGSSIFLL
jgi:hypothetical protein